MPFDNNSSSAASTSNSRMEERIVFHPRFAVRYATPAPNSFPEVFCVDIQTQPWIFPMLKPPASHRLCRQAAAREKCRHGSNRGLPRCEPPDRGGSEATLFSLNTLRTRGDLRSDAAITLCIISISRSAGLPHYANSGLTAPDFGRNFPTPQM